MIDILNDKEVKRIFNLTGGIINLIWLENGFKRTDYARLNRIGRNDANLNILKEGGATGGIFHAPINLSWENIISIEPAKNEKGA